MVRKLNCGYQLTIVMLPQHLLIYLTHNISLISNCRRFSKHETHSKLPILKEYITRTTYSSIIKPSGKWCSVPKLRYIHTKIKIKRFTNLPTRLRNHQLPKMKFSQMFKVNDSYVGCSATIYATKLKLCCQLRNAVEINTIMRL
jgi:hypothetical protein